MFVKYTKKNVIKIVLTFRVGSVFPLVFEFRHPAYSGLCIWKKCRFRIKPDARQKIIYLIRV